MEFHRSRAIQSVWEAPRKGRRGLSADLIYFEPSRLHAIHSIVYKLFLSALGPACNTIKVLARMKKFPIIPISFEEWKVPWHMHLKLFGRTLLCHIYV